MTLKKKALRALIAIGLALGLIACESPQTLLQRDGSGSLALSNDGSMLYALDRDNERVAVLATGSRQKIAEGKVGRAPERVVVGPDDTVYVSNRGERSVSILRPGQWADAEKVENVGIEPVGLAVAADNKTLYVVSSTALDSSEYGTLTAIALPNLKVLWTLPVGEEPRAITLVDGEKAIITQYKTGDVVQVDLRKPEVVHPATARAPSIAWGALVAR